LTRKSSKSPNPRPLWWRVVLIVIVCWAPHLASASEDPCRVAYLHADKTSQMSACAAAANAGDADAEFQYGLILMSGVDRPSYDTRAALDWLRKSARQGHWVAQISLAGLLSRQYIAAELRDPIEAYAWLVTSGDDHGARKLRATFNESEAMSADRMASEYKAKYAPAEVSGTGWWLQASDLLARIWPGLIVIGVFLVARRRLSQKFWFVLSAIVVAFASQYLALAALSFLANAMMMRLVDTDGMVNAVPWTFGVAFVLDLVAPTVGVWVLYRFWMRRRCGQAVA
jgi:TPR repeat protein